MFYHHLKGHIEALLFASGDTIPVAKLAGILEVDETNIRLIVEKIREDLLATDRGLTIVEVAGGFQLCTKPELASVVEKLAHVQEVRLSVAAMETLSIVAFKQPITRQEIERIRGVQVDKLLNNLLDRCLIREVGRKDAVGRPILYGTTKEFLECFGLEKLKDLPKVPDTFIEQQPE